VRITARFEFEAAHRLHDPTLSESGNERLFGPCANVHGHTYGLEVTLSGKTLQNGMLANFTDVDAGIRKCVIDRLDHNFLDEVDGLGGAPSTAEQIALWIWRQIDPILTSGSVAVEMVTVYEGKRFSATVTREDLV
jgi:6-pyruvoyltetrahydropterin/6-carboxytetrahydropterin synthase